MNKLPTIISGFCLFLITSLIISYYILCKKNNIHCQEMGNGPILILWILFAFACLSVAINFVKSIDVIIYERLGPQPRWRQIV
jgi:hypothetical protein